MGQENKFFEKLVIKLKDSGWERTSQYGVLQNGHFYFILYLDDEEIVKNVVFTADSTIVPNLTGIRINKQSWHLEYNGLIMTFGKVPRYVFNQNSDSKHTDSIKSQLDNYTTADPDVLYFCRASYGTEKEQCDKYRMEPISKLIPGDIYCELNGVGLFYVLQRQEGIHTLIRVVPPDENVKSPAIFMEQQNGKMVQKELSATSDQINKAVSIGSAKLFERVPEAYTTNVAVWTQSEVDPVKMTTLFKRTELYKGFDLDAQHKRYLANAILRKLPVAALLDKSLSAITIAGIYALLRLNLPVTYLNTSFSSDAMEALVKIAKDGISLKKYAVAGYSAARIQKLYADFTMSFETLRTKLTSEGFSKEQISYIREVASDGKGISSVYNHDPVLVNRMHLLADTGYMSDLLNYMTEYTTDGGVTCSVPWATVPDALKALFRESFLTFPSFISHGKSWEDIINFCFDKADSIIYRHPFGLMMKFGYNYLTIKDNYVAIRNSGFENVWIAELINNNVYVNDFDFPAGLWDETSN